MSKHFQRLTVPNQRPKATETQLLETVKTQVREGSSAKSAWSLTKIQASSERSLK